MNLFSVLLCLVAITCALRWHWRGAIISAAIGCGTLWLAVSHGATFWLDLGFLPLCAALSAALGGEVRLEHLAFRDAVTGLPDGAHWRERLEELRRSARDGQAPALLLIDVDDLARLNDVHGMSRGDDALREVAACVRASIRAVDFPCRLRSDEFAVVLPETEKAGASLVAERIRRAVEERAAQNRLPLSVSVGALEVQNGYSTEECLAFADSALFEARRTGRNRVVFYDPEM